MNRIQALTILHLTQSDSLVLQKIKTAYFREAHQHHPDMGGDLMQMQLVNIAYDVLIQNLATQSQRTENSAASLANWNIDSMLFNNFKLLLAAYELSNIWLLTIKSAFAK